MDIAIALIVLILGFFLLIKGADYFVDGSSTVAKKLRVPSILVGLTIVALGTSLPELAVSVTASVTGNNALAVSNVIGSNIFNLIVVCGSCALFSPLFISRDTLTREFPFSVFCIALLLILGWFGMEVGRADGLLLLILFFAYLFYMIFAALRARKTAGTSPEDFSVTAPLWRCALFIIGGIIAIKFGGDFVVDGASTIAERFGVSQTLIGLTVVALGTSLPELVTSVVAARKKELDMALGNVIGSNVFNVLLILGCASAISPIAFARENGIDILLLLAMCLLVWIVGWARQRIDRSFGIVLLGIYFGYLVYICLR